MAKVILKEKYILVGYGLVMIIFGMWKVNYYMWLDSGIGMCVCADREL